MTFRRVIIALVCLTSLSGAQIHRELSHSIQGIHTPVSKFFMASSPIDTIHILAIMVQFQVDADDQTTGDGTFQLSGSSNQIDPPPHDTLYFTNKIRFVKNYFRKVSNGILTVDGMVLNQRITLPQVMKMYSPPIAGNDNQKLAQLAIDGWKKADTLFPAFDFSQFDLFVIFHAGAGRDIDLVSTLGTNPTPYDIPSLYMDSTAFARALSTNSFTGISVHNASIKNTIILPETESRDVAGELIQLSINGLFAASVGSYLKLPDLFDTKTGRSAIGRFGLMDGASIFAFSGMFPPEPNAWEKIRLGWATPTVVRNSPAQLFLPAMGISQATRDSVKIYQVPISQSEYFLLENRNRDPEGNGLHLTVVQNGRDTTLFFETDRVGFRIDDITGFSGSVADVDDFDWALPGEMDGTGRFDGGGILIWHIDEDVINSGLITNTINVNTKHRGVDLIEADGSKDIGQSYDITEPGYGTENGSPLDCWFSGNSAVLYKNSFDRYSFPNSNSFSGAASLVTINNFSARSAYMSARVELGTQVLRRNSDVSRKFSSASIYPTSTKNHHLYICTNDSIFAFQSDGKSLTNNSSGLLSGIKADKSLAVSEQGSTEIVACVHDSTLNIFQLSSPNVQGGFDNLQIITRTINQLFSTDPCFLDSSIILGTEKGIVYRYRFNGDTISTRVVSNIPIESITVLPVSSTSKEYFATTKNAVYNATASITQPIQNSLMVASAISPKGNFIIAAEKNGNRIYSFSQSLGQNFYRTLDGPPIQELETADINGDGEKDIIIQSNTQISVLSRDGIMLDGFPVQVKGNSEFTGIPLLVDFNGDGQLEIMCFTTDGAMWVYDRNGKMLSGFAIQVSSPGIAYPMLYTTQSDTLGIAILSESGSFDAFLTSTVLSSNSPGWWQYLGNENHTNAEWTQTSFSPPQYSEFMPKARVYNWPNPVYGRSTQIRYFTAEDANITVTILDLSGVKITEFKGRGTAGMDNEISWDVSNIQSGIYLARIEAQGSSKSEVAIIKIAVVK